MKVKEIVKVTRGRLLSGDPDKEIDLSKVSTDSRSVKKGEFFVALKGANFDGDRFAGEALCKGAIGAVTALCFTGRNLQLKGKIIIQVKDTTKALSDIASAHRKKFKIPVIAITGSNGKTTVKDMTAAVLSTRYNVLKNEGTKNNNIGLPQTLLKLDKKHGACVVELGTNHKGEIRELSVITNVGPSHLEFLQDSEGVYRAKREILDSFKDKYGTVVLNGDDKYLARIKEKNFRIVRFGFDGGNDYAAEILGTGKNKISFSVNSGEVFAINSLGIHNVYNALAAISIARLMKVPYRSIERSLAGFKPAGMRMTSEVARGIDIINDSYNSNPLSMSAALEALESYPAFSRWVVFGDMLELGDKSEYFHRMANIQGTLWPKPAHPACIKKSYGIASAMLMPPGY
ncbi:MAG: UDP-N-acetylmuramoyl-tripeptide--D-alanyl-D-alanine ligase [Candidatus Omnitrophica bacterium]|nr:UDP-N-acetylmuramoyl-tripeptide--D-alanyl-D-alanine ligase [Candidatus Omnitrophota bacterium]